MKGALKQDTGGVVVTLAVQDVRELVEALGGGGVVGAQAGLADR
jgi:hypothetical protein